MRLLVITQKVDEKDDVLGFFIGWLKALSREAEQVNVIALAQGSHSLPENVEVVSLGKEKGYPKPLKAVIFYIQAFRLLRRSDGVFIHMAPEYVRALYPLNLFFKRPVVMWYAHIKVSETARWALRHVDFVLTPSKESFEHQSDKVVSTGHGIDTDTFKPLERAARADVLSLSRISRVKRIETLIEAAGLLVNDRKRNVTVDIYGNPARLEDDAYLEVLKLRADALGLERSVVWKGGVANCRAPEVYASHRVFARMQGGGGFGKTELEAMAMGIPAILPTPVYREDLGEFADDLYFPEGDAAALAERISTVLAWAPERRKTYGERARALVVKKHNVETVARKVVELLNRARKG